MNRLVIATLILLAIVCGMYARAAADTGYAPGYAPAVDWASHDWTGAETPLPPSGGSCAEIAETARWLWSHDSGDIWTWLDGKTQVRLTPDDDGCKIDVLANAAMADEPGFTDECLVAQLRLGHGATFEDVDAACAGLPMNAALNGR